MSFVNNFQLLKTKQIIFTDYALIQFSAPNIRSENGPIVEVDPGFKSAMDNLNSFAQTCNVTVSC